MIELKQGHYVGPYSNTTDVLIKKGKFEQRAGKPSSEQENIGWSDVFTRQGTQRLSENHQKPGEKLGTDFPSQPTEGTNPAVPSISDFYSAEL